MTDWIEQMEWEMEWELEDWELKPKGADSQYD